MRNKIDDLYGYNDTVSAMISKMCLEAYSKYDIENESVNHRQAMARAIGDTLKNHMKIYNQSYTMDRELLERELNNDNGYVSYIEKAIFMKFAESIYESGNYRIKKINNNYEYVFEYQLALFNIGEL